ncbi:MAG TPA: AMP-binding protein [Acidimicrobiales bacterium]|nr:AMP-binding protein [Acidimicrobiales bacterium]
MTSVEPPMVPAARAARYRAEGLWDDRGVADGIEAGAARRPAAIAVADNERRITYAGLERSVAAGVSLLHAAGVESGDAAVLVAGNTVEGVVAYHALLRTGATAVLLDRRCGPADVVHARTVTGGRGPVIVPAAERDRLLPDAPADVLLLERFGAVRDIGSRWPEPERDRPAVVLFTSGTTARPKGVVHSLNTLTAGAANMARITGATQDSVLFLVSPLTSIAGVMQVHLAADQHATLVLEDRFDPDASLDRANAAGATLLGGAPVIAERLLRAAEHRGTRRVTLRTLALGGAMLPRPLLETAIDVFGIDIARVYGSSEAPNFSGSTPDDDRDRRLSDDGALMPGSEVRVGSAAHPQEGLLRGPGVFLGYVDAEDNAAAFDADWYRTGDLVDVHGGRLTVIGRLKEVVNRNGLKISLSEVDAALAGLPGAIEHAAFAMPDPATGERLVVAVVPEAGAAVTLDDVVSYLVGKGTARRKLPEEVVVWEGALPRTASGKVVRSRLVMDAPAKRSDRAARLQ